MGGTMRRGSKLAFFKVADSKSAKLSFVLTSHYLIMFQSLSYGSLNHIDERYRHRFQVNPSMVPLFENSGLEFVAIDKTGEKTEIIEIPDHRFFVGVQFHPEFKSRPSKPSALFDETQMLSLTICSTYTYILGRANRGIVWQLDRVLQDAAKGNHEPEQNRREEKRRASDHLGSETCRSKRQVMAGTT
uniref:CTP synthase (glutamine hydrolyzing) n=1 Tax=Oryza brachyantha TaxID=4533 RepID=J3M9X3_ORYBR